MTSTRVLLALLLILLVLSILAFCSLSASSAPQRGGTRTYGLRPAL